MEKQQKEFTNGWDTLFIGYSDAVYFHTSDIKINSWTMQAKKLRGSMPPKFEVQDILRTLEEAELENKMPIWDDGKMIVEEGHIALKDEMKFATRNYRTPFGLEELELRQEGKKFDAAGPLCLALTEYKKLDPATPSPLSVGTPGDKRSHPVENRFRDSTEKEQAETEQTLKEAELENKMPIWDDGRMIVEEEHIALKDEMKFATRKYRAPYGLEELELRQEGKKFDAAGSLYIALTEYKKLDPATPSPLSVGTPGNKRSHHVENRFIDALEKEQAESGEGESMDETLSEAGEEMEVGNTPDQDPAERDFTTQELLQDLSGDDWANTATPPLGSPR